MGDEILCVCGDANLESGQGPRLLLQLLRGNARCVDAEAHVAECCDHDFALLCGGIDRRRAGELNPADLSARHLPLHSDRMELALRIHSLCMAGNLSTVNDVLSD